MFPEAAAADPDMSDTETGRLRDIIHKLIDDIISEPKQPTDSEQRLPMKRKMMEFLGKRSPEKMEGIYENEKKRKYMEFLG